MTDEAPLAPDANPLVSESAPAPSEAPQGEPQGEVTDADIVASLRREVAPPDAQPVQEGPSKAEEYIARVVKQQQRLQAEKRRLKEEAARNAQALENARQYQELQELAKTDPLAAHQRLNLDADQLVRRMVEEGEKHRPLSVEERLERIEAQRQADIAAAEEQARQHAESRHNQELDHHINSYKGVVSQLATENVDRYELINIYGQADRVWNEALAYYKQHGTVPHPEVVMDAVEQDLRNYLKPLLSTTVFKSLMQEYQGKSKPAATVSAPRPASLTNSIARSSTNLKKTEDEESDDEREQAAIAILTAKKA